MLKIVYLIPVYNKERILIDTTTSIFKKFESNPTQFNIVFIENDSEDNSYKALENLSLNNSNISILRSPKGFGNALSKGFDYISKELHGNFDYLIITGADLPFGFTDIDFVLNNHDFIDQEIYIGSKMHKDSSIKRTPTRKIISWVFNRLLNLFFKVNFKDTQGSLIIDLNKTNIQLLKPISSGFFASAEICINAKDFGYKVREIPIELFQSDNDISTVKIFSDSKKVLVELLRFRKYRKDKTSDKTD